jgi:hypothetical protein
MSGPCSSPPSRAARPPTGVSRNECALRLLAGLGLVAIGLATGPRWVLVAAGAAFLVFAFHDRLRRR